MLHGIVAASDEMKEVLDQVRVLASFSDVPVLITGESGTGKELIARLLHHEGPRARRPFVAVNAAAIPDTLLEAELFGHARGAFTGAQSLRRGLLEEADSGTLFLDEVADLSPRAQTVLLRAFQEREYRRVGETSSRRSDFRLVTASHKDLGAEAAAGRFRHDLRFRLDVARIHLPPLRERSSDILPLAHRFLSERAGKLGVRQPRLSRQAEEALLASLWPGNVRELQNEVIQALIRSRGAEELAAHHFSFARSPASRGPLKGISAAFERGILKEALTTHRGNRTRTARALGISRQGLYRKLKRLGLEAQVLTSD